MDEKILSQDNLLRSAQSLFIDGKCMASCNRRGLALDLSACTVDTSMITVSSCGVKLQ